MACETDKQPRQDRKRNLDRFCTLIEDAIETEGTEFGGHVWAAKSRSEWAELLGVTVKTISRLNTTPPIQKCTTRWPCEGGKFIKATLLRVGEPDQKTKKHLANIMAKLFCKATGIPRVPRKQYGMLNGLADKLPAGYQIDIFKNILERWPSFKAAVSLHTSSQREITGNPAYHERYHKFPSISVILRFHHIASDVYKTHMQEIGTDDKAPYPWAETGIIE